MWKVIYKRNNFKILNKNLKITWLFHFSREIIFIFKKILILLNLIALGYKVKSYKAIKLNHTKLIFKIYIYK